MFVKSNPLNLIIAHIQSQELASFTFYYALRHHYELEGDDIKELVEEAEDILGDAQKYADFVSKSGAN